MPLDIYNKDFQNWLKGVLALNTTREALCETMMGGFKHFISKLPQSEKSHLRQFLSCLKVKKVPPLKQLKHLKQPTKYECRHGKCKTLFDKFLEQHTEKGKLNLEWDVSHHEVDTNESESTTTVDDVIVWEFLRLYMFADKGEHATKCQRLDDLDISNVIIIMKSCKLFYPDGSLELYDKVTNFRNELMHSASNKVSEDNLKQNVGKAIELIKLLTNQSQTEATQYLQKIGEENFDISFQSEEYKRVLVEVKQAEIIAENLQTDERSKADLKTLQETLKRIIGNGPDDISKQFVGKASALKELVKKCIEKKKKSIELDKATCSLGDDTAHKAAELEKLLQQVEQDLIEINEELTKTEEEDPTNLLESLREENTTLKTERDKAFQDNDDLNRKNESLKRDIRYLESKEEKKKTEEEDLANLLECLREENTILKTERDKAFQDNADLNRKNESLKRDIRYLESKERLKKVEIDSLKRQLRREELEIEDPGTREREQRKEMEINRLQRHLTGKKLEIEVPGTREREKRKEMEINRLQRHLTGKKLEIEDLRVGAQRNEMEIDRLKRHLTGKELEGQPKEMEIDRLKKHLRGKEFEIEDPGARVRGQQKEIGIDNLEEELRENERQELRKKIEIDILRREQWRNERQEQQENIDSDILKRVQRKNKRKTLFPEEFEKLGELVFPAGRILNYVKESTVDKIAVDQYHGCRIS